MNIYCSDRLISSEMRELDFGFVNVGDSRILTFKVWVFFEKEKCLLNNLRLKALWIFP